LLGAEPPQAEISNGSIHAKLYLPDPEQGYYRGTRFDWSGVIHSLRYEGHEYFGQWFDHYDPKIHDAIMGPVEEFRTNDTSLGYEEAKPGETFIRIGVGVVRKPDEPAYRMRHTYDIVDAGKWTVRKGRDWIRFVHRLTDVTGYAYEYRKTLRLAKNRPVLVIEHALRNTGRRPIETSQYNHNFFVIDGQPTGPDFTVRFPFELRAARDLKDLAEVRGDQLIYLRELEKGGEAATGLEGFGKTAADYNIAVENRKTGAGVKITGDQPLSRLYFWSIRTTLCPEPYVQMRIEPGRRATWKIEYEFYTLWAER
jgi:hypothetical protein